MYNIEKLDTSIKMYFILADSSGIVTGFSENCKEFSIKTGAHISDFLDLEEKSDVNWNNFF